MNKDYKEWMKEKLKSEVYNALSEIMEDYPDATESDMDEAIEWFQVHFFK